MDDPLSRGLPFELADIWRRSTLQVKDDDHSLFAPLEASFPDLKFDTRPKDFENELFIPPLADVNGTRFDSQHLEPPRSDIASPPSELWDTGQSAPDDPASVWDLDLSLHLPPQKPRLSTWEAFERKSVPNAERTAYLSEAGPRAFNAVLAEREGKSDGVLPQDVMLRALCTLALGRDSIFFQWNEQKATFTRTLEDVPISGYSSTACDSLIQHLVDYATLYRSLRTSCTDVRPKRNARPCLIAFYGCVDSILDAAEEHITNQLSQVRSVLQLQALVDQPQKLLSTLGRIHRSVDKATSEEDIISALSDHVHEIFSANSSLGRILRTVLEWTSAPWLETLAMDLGLVNDPIAARDARIEYDMEASFTEPDSSALSAHLGASEPSGLMNSADRALIRETKASLRVVRKTLPQYSGDSEARALFQTALGRKTSLSAATTRARQDSGNAAEAIAPLAEEGSLAWADPDHLALTDLQMSSLPQNLHRQDESLRSAALAYCSRADPSTDLATNLVMDLSPLDLIRPALSAQNLHLNRTLLRHLFTNNLMHHLRLQHSYHFLSSGEFVTHLSTALFSAETQSAERKRGTIPTGQTMGLRLAARKGDEQRWPPASSELRLTLADVLNETYRADYPVFWAGRRSKESPGGLSFSIRELPEHEIERVMDPTSIYALDFLRLQYAAPTPLDAVLTASSMQVYDSIFRQLLRLLRVLHVTTCLSRAVANRRQEEHSPLMARFAQGAQAFITTLLPHFMDVGIADPWRALTKRLGSVERSLESGCDAAVVGIEALKQMHMACLDTIRSRLLLRRKQEKLRLAVEEVLSAVLNGAASFESDDDAEDAQDRKGEHAVQDFERAVKQLLEMLRCAVDKPPKLKTTLNTNAMIDTNDDDGGETMRLLLERLNWNGFYGETSS